MSFSRISNNKRFSNISNQENNSNLKDKIFAVVKLSRPPFHVVGLLPYILGNVLSYELKGIFKLDISLIGALGLILVMLATYYSGEYWDYFEDSLSSDKYTKFSGGSQVIQKGFLSRNTALYLSIICVIGAIIIGSVLQFVYITGEWTLFLGIIGITGGFFYSAKPIRWISRGIGELWILFCYSWLPISAAYYIQIGNITPLINFLSIPIGLTIFNVILLNEFPDYESDLKARKNNLIVRLGIQKASYLYSLICIVSWISILLIGFFLISSLILILYIPFFLISLFLVISIIRNSLNLSDKLERYCSFNIIVNLGTTLVIILTFLW